MKAWQILAIGRRKDLDDHSRNRPSRPAKGCVNKKTNFNVESCSQDKVTGISKQKKDGTTQKTQLIGQ
jgi:hypothetical protein